MNFSECLNKYIDMIDCSGKDLSKISGISPSVISRYRSGERIPEYNSKQYKSLINALYILSNKSIKKSIIEKDFESTVNKNDIDFNIFKDNLNILINELNINARDISEYIGYDPSYLSKIRKGVRKPNNIEDFSKAVAKYISNNYNDLTKVSSLVNIDLEKVNKSEIENIIFNWITNNSKQSDNKIEEFLEELDKFDLNEYIKKIKFDKIKVPTMPVTIQKSKNYIGLKGYKNSQIDVLKQIILSKSKDDVIFYSNMSMIDASKDIAFKKKFMIGLAVLLKKGIKLNMIHDLDRPFKELIIGLTGWIPLYMTGQIRSFYLKDNSNKNFSQIIVTSGNNTLYGSGITNNIELSNYYFTSKQDEIDMFKNMSKNILKKSYSLITIYNKDNIDEYNKILEDNNKTFINRKNILTRLPIYTISDELLNRLIKNNNVSSTDEKKIIDYVNIERKNLINILKNATIKDEISKLRETEFNESDYVLNTPISNIKYTYEDYLKHISNIKSFSKKYKNYSYEFKDNLIFKNINIHIIENKQVIISKLKDDQIHFLIEHPTLINAISNLK